MKQKTFFAPAERATMDEISHSSGLLIEAGIVDHLTHVIPSVLMVLNKERQVVYANKRLQELIGANSAASLLGLRPGEILHCIHSHKTCSGCGTSEFCQECGAVNAIMKSQKEQIGVEAECRITTDSGDSLDFKVWASPHTIDNNSFTIFSIVDIQDEKRRAILEQTFLHDAANLLTAISAQSTLLGLSLSDPEECNRSLEALQTASRELINEIQCYQKLQKAEDGSLQLCQIQKLDSLAVLHSLTRLYPDPPIQCNPASEPFSLHTDKTLLFRILFNMLKNAREASEDDEMITLSCRKENDRGVFIVHNQGYIPRDVQLQVFQRSFSTKGTGRGLGTYIMRLFGEKYLGGNVGFNTSEEHGTSFYITLPLECPSPK